MSDVARCEMRDKLSMHVRRKDTLLQCPHLPVKNQEVNFDAEGTERGH